MRFTCFGGLCNRLRTALSYYAYARSLGEELVFTWPLAPTGRKGYNPCPGKFENHFEPIDGLTFTDKLDRDEGWEDRRGPFPHPQFKPDFTLLKPKYETCMLEGEYNAMHIRSSEHWVGNRENPSEFLEFARFKEIHNERYVKPVWLATDTRQTQLKFQGMEWVRSYEDIAFSDKIDGHYRHTDLKHAVIDLFMCVRADEFLGTRRSSFSETINSLRDQPGRLVSGGTS